MENKWPSHNDPISIPPGADAIISTLRAVGFEAYIVGGCVRDCLMGREPKDWDICTDALPEQVKAALGGTHKIYDTGIKHGTVTVVAENIGYEVTTYRIDKDYSDGRHPDTVEFTHRLRDDVQRRDFTMNAIAYDSREGYVDHFGGRQDIENKLIRCVDDSNKRFEEDALRILRALRFSAVLGFDIEEHTSKAIHNNCWRLSKISAERIQSELVKLLAGQNALNVLLEYSDVISFVVPQLRPCVGFEQKNRYHQYTVYDHTAHAVANYTGNDPVVNVALLLHDIGKPLCYTEDENGGHFHGHGVYSHELAAHALEALRFDNATRDAVLELVLYHDNVIEPTPKTVRRWLNKIGVEQFERLLDIRRADILAHRQGTQQSRLDRVGQLQELLKQSLEEEQCFTMKDLAVKGRDVMALGVSEGPEVGALLKRLLGAVIDGELPNSRKELLAALAKMIIEE